MFSVNRNVCDRDQQAPQGHYLRAARYNIASQLAVCSQKNQSIDNGGGGDLLTGQEEQTVFSLSLHQLWRNPNRERRLSTTENIHLPLYLIFPSPSLPHYRTLLPNVVLLPTGPTLPPDCFSKVKPTQSRKIKGFFRGKILVEGSCTLV